MTWVCTLCGGEHPMSERCDPEARQAHQAAIDADMQEVLRELAARPRHGLTRRMTDDEADDDAERWGGWAHG